MSVNWAKVNSRRVGEKTQEIRLYCAQRKIDMTPRAFELARLSLWELLDNIIQRDLRYAPITKVVRQSMDDQEEFVARISKKQAGKLARAIVYNYIGDDLNLYPVTAEKKLLRAKVRGLTECHIPKEEMMTSDYIFVVYALTEGENFSKLTMRMAFEWFQEAGMDPIQARVFSVLFTKREPLSLKAIPQQSLFASEYRKAAKALVKTGFIYELPGELYCITETTIS